MAETSQSAVVADEPALDFAEFYDAVFASPELAAYVIRVHDDGQFTFEDANEVVAATAGKPLVDIRGRTPHEVLIPEVADCITEHLGVVVESGRPLAYHRTFDFPGGRASFKTNLMPVVRGPTDAKYVVGITRDVTQETTLIENAQHNAAMLRTLGIALPSAIYFYDIETKNISFIGGDSDKDRQKWRKKAEGVGEKGLELYIHPDDRERVEAHWHVQAALKEGEVATISYRILSHEGDYRRYMQRETVFSRNAEGNVKLVLGISIDMSEQDRIEQEVRDLSSRMLTLQIDERRRIAEELHDSTGQHLTAAVLALGNARALCGASGNGTGNGHDPLLAIIEDAAHCLSEAQREIRVLSYLLHPPRLRSHGLAEALENFAIGFGRRAGLKMHVEIAPDASMIDDESAMHLFRVCQEGLTNVYRHANARKARITLEVDEAIQLTVKDDGIGFDPAAEERILGVGLPGMRERMGRLGGSLHITGDPSGTTLKATIPLERVNGGPATA